MTDPDGPKTLIGEEETQVFLYLTTLIGRILFHIILDSRTRIQSKRDLFYNPAKNTIKMHLKGLSYDIDF